VVEATWWAPIRLSEGREWIDIAAVGCVIQESRDKVAKFDQTLSSWADANPVVRFVQVKVKEI
jgi:hypothetical protein